MNRAAFFDLDGTLLSVNSAALWVRREHRQGRLSRAQMARAALFFLGYRLSLIDVEEAIAAALKMIAGIDEQELRSSIHAWYRDDIAPLASPGAFPVLEAHRSRG